VGKKAIERDVPRVYEWSLQWRRISVRKALVILRCGLTLGRCVGSCAGSESLSRKPPDGFSWRDVRKTRWIRGFVLAEGKASSRSRRYVVTVEGTAD